MPRLSAPLPASPGRAGPGLSQDRPAPSRAFAVNRHAGPGPAAIYLGRAGPRLGEPCLAPAVPGPVSPVPTRPRRDLPGHVLPGPAAPSLAEPGPASRCLARLFLRVCRDLGKPPAKRPKGLFTPLGFIRRATPLIERNELGSLLPAGSTRGRSVRCTQAGLPARAHRGSSSQSPSPPGTQ